MRSRRRERPSSLPIDCIVRRPMLRRRLVRNHIVCAIRRGREGGRGGKFEVVAVVHVRVHDTFRQSGLAAGALPADAAGRTPEGILPCSETKGGAIWDLSTCSTSGSIISRLTKGNKDRRILCHCRCL